MTERGMIEGEWQDGEIRGLDFLAGERGMGKTTEAIRLTDQCTGPVVFFDTVGTHAKRIPSGFVPFTQPGPFTRYLVANIGRRVRAIYTPKDTYPEKHVTEVCRAIIALGKDFELKGRNDLGFVLVLDEIDTFCGSKWGDDRMPRPLYELAQYGRHFHTSMLCTAREPKTLSPRFRSQCATMRIFRTSEEDHVKFFAARIGKANAAKLPTLQKTYFLLWRAGGLDAPVSGGPRAL